jgi:hypothetical protein
MKNRIWGLVMLFAMLALSVSAIKTSLIDIGAEGEYDGRVKIYRDGEGNMVFKDDAHSTPVTLSSLSQGMREHGDLLGLGNDDHGQYITSGRHVGQHTAQFNDALLTNPDVGNHTTLGQHLGDADRHLSRSQAETIPGAWKFDAQPEFRDNIKMSHQGSAGNGDILFEDGTDDARIRWDDAYNRFEFNRKIKGPEAEMESLMVNEIGRFPVTLSGKEAEGVPTGKIENFASIEGISSRNLVDKTADEDISGQWDFLNDMYIDGDLTISGILNPLGGIKGLGKGNTVTVAKKGGDYQTIQEAVNAAVSGDVILIYPGIYEEEVTINKSNISLIGLDKTKCIIQKTPAGAKVDLVRVYSASGAISGITIANLTIYNTQVWGGGGSIAQEAIKFGPGTGVYAVTDCRVYNCILKGYQDTVFCFTNSEVKFENCYIWGGFDMASSLDATVEYHNCHFHSMHTSNGNIGYQHGGTVTVEGCLFTSEIAEIAGAWDLESADLTCYFYNNEYGVGIDNGIGFPTPGGTVYAGGNWGQVVEPASGVTWGKIGGAVVQNILTVGGLWDIDTTSIISRLNEELNVNIKIAYYDNGGNTEMGIFWGTGSPNVFDVNLYRGGANILKTDDAFDANTLMTAGTERISAAGAISNCTNTNWDESHTHVTNNGTDHSYINQSVTTAASPAFVGLSTTAVVWQDMPAVSFAHGNVAGYGVIVDIDSNPYSSVGWMMNATSAPTHVLTSTGGACAEFPITNLPGSILTRLYVRWQAVGDGDGVKVTLKKRDESGTDTAWTAVGAQQTFVDAGTPFPVTYSIYDFADETMEARHAYEIEVESVVPWGGVNLFGVGIESSKRVE